MKYKFDKQELELLVKQSKCMAHLLSLVNVIPAGGNYATMNRRLKKWDIDISHWGKGIKERQGYLKGKTHDWAIKTPTDEILIKNCVWGGTTHKLRIRLIKEGYFKHQCYDCQNTHWKNELIPLELEHKNGNRTDNRIENLTLLCPNCHALTPTYRGRNKKKMVAVEGVEPTL
jgi:hypothetical protein